MSLGYGGVSAGCPTLASLPMAKKPILLHKEHPLATPIIKDAPLRVMHDGVRETLSELRSAYWLVRGRQFIRKILHSCVTCRKLEGRQCQANPPPPLPDYHMQPPRPFQSTGVDLAGPLPPCEDGGCTGELQVVVVSFHFLLHPGCPPGFGSGPHSHCLPEVL